MKTISIILLFSFTAYAAQDSLNVFLTSYVQETGNVKMVVYSNTNLDKMRQMIKHNNTLETIEYKLPYIIEDYLEVIGTSEKSGTDLKTDHKKAIIDAKRSALIYLGINTDYMSGETVNATVSDIFINQFYISKIGYSSDSTYQVLLSGKLNTNKVLQYSLQNNPTKTTKGTFLAVVGIIGIVVIISLGKKVLDSLEWN